MPETLIIEPAGNEDYVDDEFGRSANQSMETGSTETQEPYISLIKHLNNLTKEAGESVRFKCEVDGYPLPIDFKWLKNNAPVEKVKGRITFRQRSPGASILRISDLNVHDTGYYECQASNPAGKAHSVAVLKVIDSSISQRRSNSATFIGVDSKHQPTHRGRNNNDDYVLGTCQYYNGQACSRYLNGRKVYIRTDDSESFMDIERMVQDATNVISNSSQVSEPCKHYAEKASCFHSYEICDENSELLAQQRQGPSFLRICKEDCLALEADLCQEEYMVAKSQDLVGKHKLLPDCSELPNNVPKCVKILGDFNENSQNHSCYYGNGVAYRGTVSVTENGHRCQSWAAASRKFPEFKSAKYSELTANNYCRNPGGEKLRPWCFTANGKEEYCRIQVCPPGYNGLGSGLNLNTLGGGGGRHNSVGNDDLSGFTGFIGLPPNQAHYVFLGAGALGLLFLAVFFALVYKYVRLRRSNRKKKKMAAASFNSNGFAMNGLRKTNMNHPDQQTEMMHLIGQSSLPSSDTLTRIPFNNVRLLEKLGDGQYGKVWKGELLSFASEDDEPIQVALKTLNETASAQQRKDFERETLILSRLRHPNIVALLGICSDENVQSMVFEFMMHGDLHQFLVLRSPYNSQFDSVDNDRLLLDHGDFLHIATQISAGMQYLAMNHYVHRDLAARNCLVTDRLVIKVCDFGFTRDIYASDYYAVTVPLAAQQQPHQSPVTKFLPIRWMSPEAIVYGCFTETSDVWAFGVTLWEMYSYGAQPYFGCDNADVLELMRQRSLLECPENCSPRMYSLMVECWHEVPARRPTFLELHSRLQTWSVVSSPAHSTIAPLVPSAAVGAHLGSARSGSVLSAHTHSSGHVSNAGSISAVGGGCVSSSQQNAAGGGCPTPVAVTLPNGFAVHNALTAKNSFSRQSGSNAACFLPHGSTGANSSSPILAKSQKSTNISSSIAAINNGYFLRGGNNAPLSNFTTNHSHALRDLVDSSSTLS